MIKRINEFIQKYKDFDVCNIGNNELEDHIVTICFDLFITDLEELKKIRADEVAVELNSLIDKD